MKRIRLNAIVGTLIVGLSGASAFAQSGNSSNGATATCYKARIGGIGPLNIVKNMQRIEAHHAHLGALIGSSPRAGKDPLEYVWGGVPFERKEGFNGRDWGRAYFVVERIEYFDRTQCRSGEFYFSSPAQAVNWYMEYSNQRSKGDPQNRIASNWPENVVTLEK
ncbi:MAG: hypothetical protein ACI9UT_001536 [Flavobacteriales bacterium]|jgi:hypothetical protein